MDRISRIAQCPRTKAALDSFVARKDEIIEWIVAVQQIPAPTFSEAERAAFIESRFRELGLKDVWRDSLHNVYGRSPGANPQAHKPVVISAHSDTVFPSGTDLQLRRDKRFLHGPGVGDNSTGVAGLFAIAETLNKYDLQPNADLWIVSNVGEEGLGDLCGMRAVVNHFGHQAIYIVVEGGLYGQIAHEAIGVRRFRIAVETTGGHSWGSFGNASAIHELGQLIAAIDRLNVPQKPKTTYNVGMIEGGTSINTIAALASMLLDLRSADSNELDRLVSQVGVVIQRARKRAFQRKKIVKITVEQVGSRPAGRISRNSPLVGWADAALRYVGSPPVIYVSGSTDANIPLSLNIPSVCIGLTESANSHRLDEYIDTSSLPEGLQQLLLLALAAADYRTPI